MSKYQENKEKIRQEAIEWQLEWTKMGHSYYDLSEYKHYFYKMGKRYGLLKEFRENGIC